MAKQIKGIRLPTFSVRLSPETLDRVGEVAAKNKWSRNKAIQHLLGLALSAPQSPDCATTVSRRRTPERVYPIQGLT